MLRTVLLTLIFLRLLWPPGICICHLFDAEPAHHDHEDHLPGCPASKIAMTLSSMKQDPPRMEAHPEIIRLLVTDDPVSENPDTAYRHSSPSNPDPSPQPLFLILRALRI